MHTHDLEKEIRDVLDLTAADAFDPDTPWYVVASTWTCEIAEAVHALTLKLDQGQLLALSGPATQVVLSVWDDVVVPQDVPGIPAGMELLIESYVRSALPSIVLSAFALAGQKAA